MTTQSLFINGKWTKGSSRHFVSENPATGEVIWRGGSASVRHVEEAVSAARAAFVKWSGLSIEKRRRYLTRFSKQLAKQKKDFAQTISLETGKPSWESLAEVGAMLAKVDISFRAYEERCRLVRRQKDAVVSLTRFKPHGVAAVFGPFNLPGHLPNGHIVPALLAGNTVVFKPSEQTPLTGEKLVRLWQDTGLPAGVLNLLQGARATAATLSTHPGIHGIYFTGSDTVGRRIHKALAGEPGKILALEMGGNNPLVVMNVGNIKAAIYHTMVSAFITSGQRCVCARRLMVLKGKWGDEFLEQLTRAVEQIRVGAFTETPEPFMGPVISAQAAQRILTRQKRLLASGARALAAAAPAGQRIHMLRPGILDVTRIKKREDVEIFGPLLQVIRVRNLGEAIREANDTAFGLAAGILSDKKSDALTFFNASRAGIVNWNRPLTGAASDAPFGGIGRSGNHRPSAYYAADYTSYPVASLEANRLAMPKKRVPGLTDQL